MRIFLLNTQNHNRHMTACQLLLRNCLMLKLDISVNPTSQQKSLFSHCSLFLIHSLLHLSTGISACLPGEEGKERTSLGRSSMPPWRKAIPKHKATAQTPGLNTKGRAQSRNYYFLIPTERTGQGKMGFLWQSSYTGG